MPAADPRYLRLLEATREAARHGYDAVQMRDLAAATHMSLASIYHLCSSKDHLISQAHLDWIEEFGRSVKRRPPSGATPADRVVAVFRKFCRSLEINRTLTLTILRALSAPEPSVAATRAGVSAAFTEIIDVAIGDDEIPDRYAVAEVLGYVLDSVLHRWANDALDLKGARDVLERAARLVVRP